ncbi:hypothetical protein I6A84_29740 [Frankia sp. CNm7]|uniref:Uncharacterized protein n=1 Tax=Frankia nepalensis TaxID=1836974 RepID=A0A937RLP0_9ACTN|nr:hypothetical protein [Frankia nepalensis]MBL7501819.1 hypothetical protein [Frankia nepalensis]MBL7512339.1 hypothetical protein [Frankia nepalensis]MBL7522147.1 hypothetical protein [Frankia nepalensis]MBL7632637.1 hypothetical protein [Frankia nepalensis]
MTTYPPTKRPEPAEPAAVGTPAAPAAPTRPATPIRAVASAGAVVSIAPARSVTSAGSVAEGSSDGPPAPAGATRPTRPTRPAPARRDGRAVLDVYTLAALAAGIVHIPVTQAHGPGTLLGGGMLAVAAAQSLLALLAWAWAIWPLVAAGVAVNAGAALVLVLGHTTGAPVGALREPEPFTAVAAAVAGLEAVATLAGLLLLGRFAGPSPARRWLTPVAGALVLAVAIPAALAGGADDHVHGAAGHGHGAADAAAHDAGSGPPLSRYAAFTAGMTPDQIAAAIDGEVAWTTNYLIDNGGGGAASRDDIAAVVEAGVRESIADGGGNGTAAGTGSAGTAAAGTAAAGTGSTDAASTGATEASGPHGHSGLAPWQPIGDPATRASLATALEQARSAALAAPTAADAQAAGYSMITPYIAGIAAHYVNLRYLTTGAIDPAKPEMLLYAGNGPTAPVVGVSYLRRAPADTPPEGLPGPNDLWHFHTGLCQASGLVIPVAEPSAQSCARLGGVAGGLDGVTSAGGRSGSRLWMMHAWVVPGWESPWGLFSAENPELTLAAGAGR